MKNSIKKAREVLESQGNISWQPTKIGDSISGTFSHFSPVGKNGMYIHLKDSKPISFSSALKNILTLDICKSLNEKSKLKFVFKGTTKGKRGNDTKLYDVFLNGKKLESQFGRTASEKDLEDFFS